MTATNTGHSFRALERQYTHLRDKLEKVLSECYTGDLLQDDLARSLKKWISDLEDQAARLADEYRDRT